MAEITITLDKEAIYHEVKKLAGYAGKKQTDATGDTAYDVMHITSEEEEMLDQYYTEAEGMLMDILKPFVAGVSVAGIVCKMPSNWDINLQGTLQDTVNDIMTSIIAAKWLRLNSAKSTEEKSSDAEAKMMELRRKLYWKRPPSLSE